MAGESIDNPRIVETWSDFVTAVRTNDYVAFPEGGGEIDVGEIEGDLLFRTTHIQGNGWKLKNINPKASRFLANQTTTTIENLAFDFEAQAEESKRYAIWVTRQVLASFGVYRFKFLGCFITAKLKKCAFVELYDGNPLYCQFSNCNANFELNASTITQSSAQVTESWANAYFLTSYITLSGEAYKKTQYFYLQNSYISGHIPFQSTYIYPINVGTGSINSTNSIVNATIIKDSIVYGASKPNRVFINVSRSAGEVIGNGALTDSELKDPAYLSSLGFPIGTETSAWQIKELVNYGYPYNINFIGVPVVVLVPTEHQEHIKIYDMAEPQTGYQHNGLAILAPTKAEITEEENGMYEYTLSHPIDDCGRWAHLLEHNVIKSRSGQLYRIYRRELSMDSNGAVVNVNARHISYDLNDRLIKPCFINGNGHLFIDHIYTYLYDHKGDLAQYEFDINSDVTDTIRSAYSNVSMTAVLFGADNSFAALSGAELYRDNFYMSLNKRREKARDNAFNIRYGVDMTKIRMTVDYSDLCTWLIAEDNFGNYWASSYVSGDYRFHHHVTKYVMLNYDTNDYERFRRDAKAYFDRYWKPNVSFEVEFAPLQNDPLYADFLDLQHCNVGDTGRIYCEPLKIDATLKVVAKKTNDITGETISVTINNLQNSFVRQKYMSSTVSSGTSAADKQMAAIRQELRNTKLKMLTTWRNASAFKWHEVAEFTWREVSNNNG